MKTEEFKKELLEEKAQGIIRENVIFADDGDVILFEKKNKGDICLWGNVIGKIGSLIVSFDCKEYFNLWKDYPYKFTKEQKEIFDKENPYWANFFKDRTTT